MKDDDVMMRGRERGGEGGRDVCEWLCVCDVWNGECDGD